MTSTRSGPDVVVQVVLTVRPEHQQAVIDAIRAAGDPADVPGLRALTLLQGADGTRVINHMRWAGRDAYEWARAHVPQIAATRDRVARLVDDAVTHVYEVA